MTRIEQEKHVVEIMIRMYCLHKEGNKTICPDCAKLIQYAHSRLDHCPFGSEKNSCRKCRIHCYRPEMATKIRTVMRYAGPRMMLYHPRHAIMHLLNELLH